ncbi:MAG: YfhO family protein, partial [Bacteroides sp.]|nr:YfhO family protein [Bacteroides sp.]
NYLKYQYQTDTDQLAVFSEIYYPEGWKVRINGEKAPPLRVNYLLRGLVVPAGSGEIEFEFRPAAFYAGGKIAWAFSFILLALIGIWVWQFVKRFRKDPADQIFDS